VQEGLNISNIKFMYNPNALNENAYFSLNDKEVIVEWNYKSKKLFESSKSVKSIGEIMKDAG
jgi:hypothetical protein